MNCFGLIDMRVQAELLSALRPDTPRSISVEALGADLADKLAAVGLIEARDNSTLADFTANYIRRRTDIKPRTRTNLEQCRARLMDFFGGTVRSAPSRRETPIIGCSG